MVHTVRTVVKHIMKVLFWDTHCNYQCINEILRKEYLRVYFFTYYLCLSLWVTNIVVQKYIFSFRMLAFVGHYFAVYVGYFLYDSNRFYRQASNCKNHRWSMHLSDRILLIQRKVNLSKWCLNFALHLAFCHSATHSLELKPNRMQRKRHSWKKVYVVSGGPIPHSGHFLPDGTSAWEIRSDEESWSAPGKPSLNGILPQGRCIS